MTQFLICGKPQKMGRKKQFEEDMQSRFVASTFARIAELLERGEDRTDFVREAVDREIVRRLRRRKQAGSESETGH